MGMILNPGNELFCETVQSEIYVDKTMLIDFMNRKVNTRQKYVCVSRPRRFGKSITADMLCAYYGRGESAKELFAPFKISGTQAFAKHLNRYDVMHINMSDFFGYESAIKDGINILKDTIYRELAKAYPGLKLQPDDKLQFILDKIYKFSNTKFVFILDEWDCIFRMHKGDGEIHKLYLGFLQNLLKDKAYVALAYMTGILPIKKYGEHSALNMFEEYSMTNAEPISEYTGFTEDEVEELCKVYDISFEETRRWYNGYQVDGCAIYNPKSVVSVMLRGKFDSYWNSTESYDALKSYIGMNMDDLREKVINMMAGASVKVNIFKFQNDMTSFASADDVLTLLVHLGYLTYDSNDEAVYIPNYEVSREFLNSIEDKGWETLASAIKASDDLLEAVKSGDVKTVSASVQRVHADNISTLKYNDENSLACVITLAFYSARKEYEIIREMPAGKGFADMVFLPRHGISSPAMIVELKYNKTAETAISQIKNKRYADALRFYKGEILLVGINYDKDSKEYECVIEKVTKRLRKYGD